MSMKNFIILFKLAIIILFLDSCACIWPFWGIDAGKSFDIKDMIAQLSNEYNPDTCNILNKNGIYLLYNDTTNEFTRNHVNINNMSHSLKYNTGGYVFHKDGRTSFFDCNIDSIEQVDNNTDYGQLIEMGFINNQGCNGLYKVVNDTTLIVNKFIQIGCSPWSLIKIEFKIIDSNTIERLLWYETSNNLILRDHDIYKLLPIANFNPLQYDYYIPTKKWMWADKKDWKEYMRQLKEYEAAKRKNQ